MNTKLKELYSNKWNDLKLELDLILLDDNCAQKPTNPLLLSINETEYLNSDLKVLILGQETNNWGDNFCGNIDEILEIYDDFYNSGYALNSYGGHFWNGINRFKLLLENKYSDKRITFIWNNVVKIGASGRDQNHPDDYIYNIELENFQILEEEIEILKPDVILFFSGPNYDNNIKNALKSIDFKELDNDFPINKLAKIIYKDYENIFRTYHPNYLWRNNINSYFDAIINNIKI